MSRKKFLSFIKQINAQIVKLSWIYLIVLSLIVLGLIQLYTNNTRNTQHKSTQSNIEQLQKQINTQQKDIEQLKKEIEKLKQTQP